jgi:hypothetical protein
MFARRAVWRDSPCISVGMHFCMAPSDVKVAQSYRSSVLCLLEHSLKSFRGLCASFSRLSVLYSQCSALVMEKEDSAVKPVPRRNRQPRTTNMPSPNFFVFTQRCRSKIFSSACCIALQNISGCCRNAVQYTAMKSGSRRWNQPPASKIGSIFGMYRAWYSHTFGPESRAEVDTSSLWYTIVACILIPVSV